jgi:hypothetical protein
LITRLVPLRRIDLYSWDERMRLRTANVAADFRTVSAARGGTGFYALGLAMALGMRSTCGCAATAEACPGAGITPKTARRPPEMRARRAPHPRYRAGMRWLR